MNTHMCWFGYPDFWTVPIPYICSVYMICFPQMFTLFTCDTSHLVHFGGTWIMNRIVIVVPCSVWASAKSINLRARFCRRVRNREKRSGHSFRNAKDPGMQELFFPMINVSYRRLSRPMTTVGSKTSDLRRVCWGWNPGAQLKQMSAAWIVPGICWWRRLGLGWPWESYRG